MFFELFDAAANERCKRSKESCALWFKEGHRILADEFQRHGLIHGHPHMKNFAYVGDELIIFDFDR
eukprot:49277-Eustigmatos_ZCMA.PRE.1